MAEWVTPAIIASCATAFAGVLGAIAVRWVYVRRELGKVRKDNQEFTADNYRAQIDELREQFFKALKLIDSKQEKHVLEISALRDEHVKCQVENAKLTAHVTHQDERIKNQDERIRELERRLGGE